MSNQDTFDPSARQKEFFRFLKSVTKFDRMHFPDPIIYFQGFQDKKDLDLPKENYFPGAVSNYESIFEKLDDLNSRGYGIHFSCQEFGMKGNPGEKRRKEYVSRIRTLYFDVDTYLSTASIEKLIEWSKPSIVVASSKQVIGERSSYKTHFYFLIKGEVGENDSLYELDAFESSLMNEFKLYQQLLAFKAEEFLCDLKESLLKKVVDDRIDLVDKQCVSSSLTLRLPGFYHDKAKEGQQKFLTRVIFKDDKRFIDGKNCKAWMKYDLGISKRYIAGFHEKVEEWKGEQKLKHAKKTKKPSENVVTRKTARKDHTVTRYDGATEGGRNSQLHDYCSLLFYNRQFSFNEALGSCLFEDSVNNDPPLGEEAVRVIVTSCFNEWRKSLNSNFLRRLKRGDSFAVKDLIKRGVANSLDGAALKQKEELKRSGFDTELEERDVDKGEGEFIFKYDYSNAIDFASLISDVAIAERLIQRAEGEIGSTEGGMLCGYRLDKGIWEIGDDAPVYSRMREVFYDVINEPAVLASFIDEKGKFSESQHANFIKTIYSARQHNEVASVLKKTPKIRILEKDFNGDENLIHCKNGVVDLNDGQLYEWDKDYHMTMTTGLVYGSGVGSGGTYARKRVKESLSRLTSLESKAAWRNENLWTRFLLQIFENDVDMCRYVQKIFGYVCKGRNPEELMFFLYGLGSNGKSTVIETALSMLGEYGFVAPASLFIADSRENKATILAQLPGKRLLATSEVGENKAWDEEIIKNMSGVDTINARQHREKSINFRPVFKTFVRGNHKPIIKGLDLGIKRRIRLLPFSYTISESERDVFFGDKLREILPDIFLWSVAGHQLYVREGLKQPGVAAEANRAYLAEMNPVPTFVTECFEVCEGRHGISIEKMLEVWDIWRVDYNEGRLNIQSLGKSLASNAYKSEVHKENGKSVRKFPFKLKADWEARVSESSRGRVVDLFSRSNRS